MADLDSSDIHHMLKVSRPSLSSKVLGGCGRPLHRIAGPALAGWLGLGQPCNQQQLSGVAIALKQVPTEQLCSILKACSEQTEKRGSLLLQMSKFVPANLKGIFKSESWINFRLMNLAMISLFLIFHM